MENLQAAYMKARRHKTQTSAVRDFDAHARYHLATLHRELLDHSYRPKPLKTFILRDPKTRRICVSDFADRVVHHALVNVLQPVFEPRFIHDSYASRKGRGVHAALRRFDRFVRQVSNGVRTPGGRANNDVCGFALKADIAHYFDSVDHDILMRLISRRAPDPDVLWLTRTILGNYQTAPGKGMPLGNWTSQFFANVYLNELDQFVKHRLKARSYLRYVDDFVILDPSMRFLEQCLTDIERFLRTLRLRLHPAKCAIVPLGRGVQLLGFHVFPTHRLIRLRNLRSHTARMRGCLASHGAGTMAAVAVLDVWRGWQAYTLHANTYRLRTRLGADVEAALARTEGGRRGRFSTPG